MDKLALGQVFLPVIQFSSISIIPPLLHTHPSIHLPPTLYNGFLPAFQFSPVSIIPPLLHAHPSIYHPRCIMFFSQYFSFPCQYHSTIAPTHTCIANATYVTLATDSVVKYNNYSLNVAAQSSLYLSRPCRSFAVSFRLSNHTFMQSALTYVLL